jgi:hypothetical protein
MAAPNPGMTPGLPSVPNAAVAGQMAQQAATGFLSAMVDFSFTSYVAPKLAKVLYVLVILGSIGITVVGIGNGVMQFFASYGSFERNFISGMTSIVLAPITGVALLILGRLYLEIMSVLFKIAEHLGDINRKTH